MLDRLSIGVITLAIALLTTIATAPAQDLSKYPDWSGQWERIGGGQFDPSKRGGRPQKPPLTAEYQAIWEANLAEEASGGQTYNPMARCVTVDATRWILRIRPFGLKFMRARKR